MKRKICLSLFCLLFLFAGICLGCNPNEGNPGGEKSVMLADFETEDELFLHNYVNEFGRVSLNRERAFVRHGDASAKLTVMGNDPLFPPYMMVYSETELLQKKDLSDVSAFGFSLFNAGEEEGQVLFRMRMGTKYTPFLSYHLRPGQWTDIKIPFDRAIYGMVFEIKQTQWFEFAFDKSPSEEDPFVYYIDNFYAELTEDAIPQAVYRSEDTLMDVSQGNLALWDSSFSAELSVSTDATFTREGNQSFRFHDGGKKPQGNDVAWPQIKWNAALPAVDLSGTNFLNMWVFNDSNLDVTLQTLLNIPLGTAYRKAWSLISVPVHAPEAVANDPNHPDRNRYLSTMRDPNGAHYDVTKFSNFSLFFVNSPLSEVTLYLGAMHLSRTSALPAPELELERICGENFQIPEPTGFDHCEISVVSPSGETVIPEDGKIDGTEIGYYSFNYVFERDGESGTATYRAMCFGQSAEHGNVDDCESAEFADRFWSTSAGSSLTVSKETPFVKEGAGSYLFTEKAVSGETSQSWDDTASWPTAILSSLITQDLRGYDGLGFWVFNASSDAVEIYLTRPYVGDVKLKKLFPNCWSYVTVPKSAFEALSVDRDGHPGYRLDAVENLHLMIPRKVGLDLKVFFDGFSAYRTDGEGKILNFERVDLLKEVFIRDGEGTLRISDSKDSLIVSAAPSASILNVLIQNRLAKLADGQAIELVVNNPGSGKVQVHLSRPWYGNCLIGLAEPGVNRFFITADLFNSWASAEEKPEMMKYDLSNLPDIELLFAGENGFTLEIVSLGTVRGYLPPELDLPIENEECGVGETVTLPTAAVTDDGDDDLTVEVFLDGERYLAPDFTPTAPGTYQFVYIVKDSLGNTATKTFNVYAGVLLQKHDSGTLATFNNASVSQDVLARDGAKAEFSSAKNRESAGGSLLVTGSPAGIFSFLTSGMAKPEGKTHIGFYVYNEMNVDANVFLSKAVVGNKLIGTVSPGWNFLSFSITEFSGHFPDDLSRLEFCTAAVAEVDGMKLYFDSFRFLEEKRAEYLCSGDLTSGVTADAGAVVGGFNSNGVSVAERETHVTLALPEYFGISKVSLDAYASYSGTICFYFGSSAVPATLFADGNGLGAPATWYSALGLDIRATASQFAPGGFEGKEDALSVTVTKTEDGGYLFVRSFVILYFV